MKVSDFLLNALEGNHEKNKALMSFTCVSIAIATVHFP